MNPHTSRNEGKCGTCGQWLDTDDDGSVSGHTADCPDKDLRSPPRSEPVRGSWADIHAARRRKVYRDGR